MTRQSKLTPRVQTLMNERGQGVYIYFLEFSLFSPTGGKKGNHTGVDAQSAKVMNIQTPTTHALEDTPKNAFYVFR